MADASSPVPPVGPKTPRSASANELRRLLRAWVADAEVADAMAELIAVYDRCARRRAIKSSICMKAARKAGGNPR